MTTSTIPQIISVDDHLVEPADLWTSRLPEKYRDKGPHIVMAPIDRHADRRRRDVHRVARHRGQRSCRGGTTRTTGTRSSGPSPPPATRAEEVDHRRRRLRRDAPGLLAAGRRASTT